MIEEIVNPTQSVARSAVDGAREDAALGREDFLAMLVAQLENQDPLNPQDGTEFTAQLAQFSTLEQLVEIRGGFDEMISALSQTGAMAGANLIGQDVLALGNRFSLVANARDDQGNPIDAVDTADPGLVLPKVAFDLAGPADQVIVRFQDPSGIPLGSNLVLSDVSAGRVNIDEASLREVLDGVRGGTLEYDVEATSRNDSVGVSQLIGGSVTGAFTDPQQPGILLGEVAHTLANVVEIQERRP